ncbi:MAG: DUF1289 domain-containing protein, partial [Ferrovibrio sp.]
DARPPTSDPALADEPPPSPCNKVCTIDRKTGWCLGCWRTGEEIGAWPTMTAPARHALLAQLPARQRAAESGRQ